jgi:uncharacterized phage protein gp47/JayE
MPFPIYDKKRVLAFALNTMRNRLKVNPTPGTMWYKLAEAWAETLTSVSGYQKYTAQQILPDSAQTEILERHAALRGISRKAARQSEGTVDVTLTAE